MKFVFMPYALSPTLFTDSYWANRGCQWFWSDDYFL